MLVNNNYICSGGNKTLTWPAPQYYGPPPVLYKYIHITQGFYGIQEQIFNVKCFVLHILYSTFLDKKHLSSRVVGRCFGKCVTLDVTWSSPRHVMGSHINITIFKWKLIIESFKIDEHELRSITYSHCG